MRFFTSVEKIKGKTIRCSVLTTDETKELHYWFTNMRILCVYIYIYILLRISKLHSCQIFFIFQTFSKSKNERNVHKLRWIKKKKKQPSKSLVDKNFEKQESFLIHTRIIYIVSNAKEIRSSQKSYCRKNSIFHSIFCAIIIRKNLYIEKKIK